MVLLLIAGKTAIYRQPTLLCQCCRYCVLPLSVSSDFKGAILADNLHYSITPTEGPLQLPYKSMQVLILSRYPKTMAVYFKVLGGQCQNSMYCCCYIPESHAFVPKFCRPIIYFVKTSTTGWAKHQHYIRAELIQKNLRCSNYWSICPLQPVRNFVACMIHVPM